MVKVGDREVWSGGRRRLEVKAKDQVASDQGRPRLNLNFFEEEGQVGDKEVWSGGRRGPQE